jgi:hypothetical protein
VALLFPGTREWIMNSRTTIVMLAGYVNPSKEPAQSVVGSVGRQERLSEAWMTA